MVHPLALTPRHCHRCQDQHRTGPTRVDSPLPLTLDSTLADTALNKRALSRVCLIVFGWAGSALPLSCFMFSLSLSLSLSPDRPYGCVRMAWHGTLRRVAFSALSLSIQLSIACSRSALLLTLSIGTFCSYLDVDTNPFSRHWSPHHRIHTRHNQRWRRRRLLSGTDLGPRELESDPRFPVDRLQS